MSLKEPLFTTNQFETNLNRWLGRKGLLANPFERWNAEHDQDLPNYFVDIGSFDDLLNQTEPCLVLAKRGCGKTAQRQMLAAYYRPQKPDSSRLAVSYTYAGFEQVLAQVNDDVSQVRAIHHISVILQFGVTALVEETSRDLAIQRALSTPEVKPRWEVYVARFAPHLTTTPTTEISSTLDNLGSLTLLQGFARLIKDAGLEAGVVLVDGLDEFPLTAGDPAQIATFLESLLGTLSLIECPGLAFKFLLPQEVEPILRTRDWFRPDRLHFFRLAWKQQALLDLLNQRLTYFSQRHPPYEGLAQLCEDELAQVINNELVTLAEGLPRAALLLAGTLLQYHCEQLNPPERIPLKTWERVKTNWPTLRGNFAMEVEEQSTLAQLEETGLVATSASFESDSPALRVEEEKGLVWLGENDITNEIGLKEYRVLACLYRHRDGLCTKDTLVQEAWPEDEEGGITDQAITQSIKRLRQILRQFSPKNIEYIETIRGRGYRLHPDGLKEQVTNSRKDTSLQ
jgi:DNA-binding winged helix-turn-helix (wHTH) protein